MMAKKARLSLLVAFVISLPSASAFLGGNVINWLGMNTAIKLQPNLLNSMQWNKFTSVNTSYILHNVEC